MLLFNHLPVDDNNKIIPRKCNNLENRSICVNQAFNLAFFLRHDVQEYRRNKKIGVMSIWKVNCQTFRAYRPYVREKRINIYKGLKHDTIIQTRYINTNTNIDANI